MTSLIFPDVNVWLSISYPIHTHHTSALAWFNGLEPEANLAFCRHTQLGFFRLMTTASIMGVDVKSQLECWNIYDRWILPGKARLLSEPPSLEPRLRRLTVGDRATPKLWADAYLAAFAAAAKVPLVTFDRALAERAPGSILLS